MTNAPRSEPALKPVPESDEVTRFYWDAAAAGHLAIQRCARCARWQHPPDIVCHACQHDRLMPTVVSGFGTLYSYGIAYRAVDRAFNESGPYIVALVELNEQAGLRLLTNVVDGDAMDLRIGMPMRVVFEARDAIFLPQFTPCTS